jgi:hypothetical protein
LILAQLAEVPVTLFSQDDLDLKMKEDLAWTLEQLHCGPDCSSDEMPRKKLKKHYGPSSSEDLSGKTQQVRYMLEHRISTSRVQETIKGASQLIVGLQRTSGSSGDLKAEPDIADLLYSRWSLNRHLLTLDGALDKHTTEKMYETREGGSFAGVALATDESPPSQPRFSGLRFQITVVYWGTFRHLDDWETSLVPPILVQSLLGDIMHCPGKQGVDVTAIIGKQLARLGMSPFDVVSCTGDGGGENEGSSGVHAHFEDLNNGYVRRRCLPHIAWRTMEMAMRESNLDYKALAAYMVEGITWSRFRDIAIKDHHIGGLKLFTDGSEMCKKMFGQAPQAIVDTRPESDLRFLRLLKGKEHILHQLAARDLTQRPLKTESKAAVENLGNIEMRIRRTILAEILERCMFLHYWNGKHAFVSSCTSWDELMEEATEIILELKITPEVLKRFGTTEQEVMTMNPQPTSWVEIALRSVLGEQDLVAGHLKDALDFHRRVSDKAATTSSTTTNINTGINIATTSNVPTITRLLHTCTSLPKTAAGRRGWQPNSSPRTQS